MKDGLIYESISSINKKFSKLCYHLLLLKLMNILRDEGLDRNSMYSRLETGNIFILRRGYGPRSSTPCTPSLVNLDERCEKQNRKSGE